MRKLVLFALTCVLLPLLISCQIDPKNEIVNGWTVSREASSRGFVPTQIAKTMETEQFYVTMTLAGDDSAVNEILSGKWEIGFGTESGEQILFAQKGDKGSTAPQTKEKASVSISIQVTAKSGAKTLNIGGNWSTGNYSWFTHDWIWWGTSAWTEGATGNVDIWLYTLDWGVWTERDSSQNPGTTLDNVAYYHGLGWAEYKILVQAITDSVWYGQISW